MFEALTDRFSKIFSVLSKKKNLTEVNISEALGDIRRALPASDVAFEVIETFIEDLSANVSGRWSSKTFNQGSRLLGAIFLATNRVLAVRNIC